MKQAAKANSPQAQRTRRFQKLKGKLLQYLPIYLMMVPVLVYFVVFSFYPLALGMIQSFQKEKLIGAPDWAGFSNYQQVLGDYLFHQAFINSVFLGIVTLVVQLAAAIIITICINELRHRFSRSFAQTATFLPYLFSWTVVGGIWIYLLSSNGLVNTVLVNLGLDRIGFFSDQRYARTLMVVTAAWKNAGYSVVLLMASIVSIDPTLYEAARIDGASRFKQITHIVAPTLVPTIKTLIVLGVTGMLRNFDQVFVMERAAIIDKIRSLLLYIYQQGILNFKVGKATAAATIVLLATLLLSSAVRRLVRYDDSY